MSAQSQLFDLLNPAPDPSAPWSGRTPASRATSKAAATGATHSAATLREAVYQALKRSGGLTDEEGITKTGMAPNTYRPRRVELVEAGRVVDSGETRKTEAGRAAVVWRVA